MSARIDAFLKLAVEQGGSDLHLVTGLPPRIRIHGRLHPIRFRELSAEDIDRILGEIMSAEVSRRLEASASIDFAYDARELGRFRCNVYRHAGGLGAVLRSIPAKVPTLDQLGLPPAVALAVRQPKGLVLVTGPTGSGKSTTLAAMVNEINGSRSGHVVTLEDPIEFVHSYQRCVVTQREIGMHAPSFSTALRDALREDPDVVLVGELRDPETIALALTAAETGIQILATLHTSGAARSIDRIVNVFPPQRREQVQAMLADSLRMIISQQLVPTADGNRRVPVVEILVNTVAVATMIRSGQSQKIENAIQTGAASGMQGLDATLKGLVRNGTITAEEACAHALDRIQFEPGVTAAAAGVRPAA